MTLDERIEEVPQSRERLIFGGRGTFELADVFAGQARRDVAQLKLAIVAPVQEPADDPAVSAPRVFIADAGLEEFLGGEEGVRGPVRDRDRHTRDGQRRAAPAGTSSMLCALPVIC